MTNTSIWCANVTGEWAPTQNQRISPTELNWSIVDYDDVLVLFLGDTTNRAF